MVVLHLSDEEAGLLKIALESVPINGTIGNAQMVFQMVNGIHNIMARMVPMNLQAGEEAPPQAPPQEAKEDGTGN
jgi:hypothetical protein